MAGSDKPNKLISTKVQVVKSGFLYYHATYFSAQWQCHSWFRTPGQGHGKVWSSIHWGPTSSLSLWSLSPHLVEFPLSSDEVSITTSAEETNALREAIVKNLPLGSQSRFIPWGISLLIYRPSRATHMSTLSYHQNTVPWLNYWTAPYSQAAFRWLGWNEGEEVAPALGSIKDEAVSGQRQCEDGEPASAVVIPLSKGPLFSLLLPHLIFPKLTCFKL